VETADPGDYVVRGTHSYAEDSGAGTPYPISVTISEPSLSDQSLTVDTKADGEWQCQIMFCINKSDPFRALLCPHCPDFPANLLTTLKARA
jgi:hypothetical protein